MREILVSEIPVRMAGLMAGYKSQDRKIRIKVNILLTGEF
jgi:hypothetical protein